MLFVLYIIIFNVYYDSRIGDTSAKPKLICAMILSCKYLTYNCPCFKCFISYVFTLWISFCSYKYWPWKLQLTLAVVWAGKRGPSFAYEQ